MATVVDQEDAKNMALLFFMDHLMQKNGRRTIHDLSCQFGARGFTEQMRAAVGTTQEGLTEFLAQYPSLFKLDGDEVSICGFGDIDERHNSLLQNASNRNRDYEREAVEFFEAKLRKFGPELQIKSLLGHRSQAAPEIRLISGRHLKDFAEFLQSQTEHFIVDGDRVRMKNMPEPNDATRIELDEDGRPLMGAKAKQAAVDYLKQVLVEADEEQLPPIPLDTFYQRFCDRFSHSIRQEVATNPKELLQFLKLNRAIFFIRSNKVSLVRNRPSQENSDCGSFDDESNSISDKDNNNTTTVNGSSNDFSCDQITLVKALKQAQVAIAQISSDVVQPTDALIAVDFKTVTIGAQQQGQEFLSLVVIATANGKLFVFDLAHSDSIMLESGLKELLESDQLLKVVHDAHRIANLLVQRYSIHMRHIFDTQVAHSVLQHDKFGKPMHEIRGISFINLQRVYLPDSIVPSADARKVSINWSTRPIDDQMLVHTVDEVRCLLSPLYRMLNNLLPTHCRALFAQKCLEALVTNQNELSNKNEIYRPPQKLSNCTDEQLPISNGLPNRFVVKTNVSGDSCRCNNNNNCNSIIRKPTMVDASAQTFSTGEITALAVYYDK